MEIAGHRQAWWALMSCVLLLTQADTYLWGVGWEEPCAALWTMAITGHKLV